MMTVFPLDFRAWIVEGLGEEEEAEVEGDEGPVPVPAPPAEEPPPLEEK